MASLTSNAQAIGDLWLHKAQAEWLSVPAFQQLIQDLAEVNAPRELILQARRAKRDEVQHTLLTAGISAMATGQSILVEAPSQTLRSPLDGVEGLARLAFESWTDGCLHEGLAALEVERQAADATEPRIKEVLSQVAEEEKTHEELAWNVIQWSLQEGGPEIHDLLETALFYLPEAPKDTPEQDASLRGLGALSKETRQALYDTHLRQSRERLSELLA